MKTKQEEMEVKDTTECGDCPFLLHYEFDGKKFNLPRCSVGFRDGSKVSHPCPDKPVDNLKKKGVYHSNLCSSYLW